MALNIGLQRARMKLIPLSEEELQEIAPATAAE
jgi:hypothetical protein